MIKVENLFFAYPGRDSDTILNMEFEVEKGEIFGFLGPSGSGKSTTQKILTGVLKGFRGSVTVSGIPVAKADGSFYENIGVSFEVPNLYSKFTGRENLEFASGLYRKETVQPENLLKQVDLHTDADRKVSQYSKGMRMRLNFCRALINNPELLFLDEPTSGLDPVNARLIKELIKEQQRMGKTIFLTTHNMQVADELCDRVAFIVDGAIAEMDKPEELKLRSGSRILKVGYRDGETLAEKQYPLDGLYSNSGFLELSRSGTIESMHSMEASLEDVFIAATGRALI